MLAIARKQTLAWYDWVSLFSVAFALCVVFSPRPVTVALAVHLLCDFTFQSGDTAMNKGNRGKHLLVHSLIGGLPLAVAGMMISPQAVISGAIIGVLSHYAIDYTRKFSLPCFPYGLAVDQLCHIAVTLLVI